MSVPPSVKKCSRCAALFVCNPANIAVCQCSALSFTEQERAFLAQMPFDDCLCLACLTELKALAANSIAPAPEAP